MKKLLVALVMVILLAGVAGHAEEDINSRIDFFDGEKNISINIKPNKVYKITPNTGTYGSIFRVVPGSRAWEYPNDPDCIGPGGTTTFLNGRKDCSPKMYGKDWGEERTAR